MRRHEEEETLDRVMIYCQKYEAEGRRLVQSLREIKIHFITIKWHLNVNVKTIFV